MGGPRMAAAGVEILVDPTAHAAVGTSEALGRIPGLYRAYKTLVGRLREGRPRALVLIDFPEFNLRLAKQARRVFAGAHSESCRNVGPPLFGAPVRD